MNRVGRKEIEFPVFIDLHIISSLRLKCSFALLCATSEGNFLVMYFFGY